MWSYWLCLVSIHYYFPRYPFLSIAQSLLFSLGQIYSCSHNPCFSPNMRAQIAVPVQNSRYTVRYCDQVLGRVPSNEVGRNSSVGIATRYRLDGPGDRVPQEARFSAPVQTRPWGPPTLLYNGYRVFLGVKSAGAWRWPPIPSSAEVKEIVELYLYSPSGPSCPVVGWTLPLPLHLPSNKSRSPFQWDKQRCGRG